MMAMMIRGIKPPIPALIGRNKTPAPIAVPYRPNIHMVSVLRQVLVEPEAAEAMVPVCVVSINISEVNTLI
ncbi:hypothetical protein D3C80_618740 [compost metagenome]